MSDKPETGTIGWTDLTVQNAEELRDFYQAVVGWRPEALDMGGHSDFTMHAPETGKMVAGVCHALGENAGLPPVWLIYIYVDDLDASIAHCIERGGQIVAAPRGMGSSGRFCIIRDPAGAVSALFEAAKG